MKKFTFIDLFAGIGGIRLGFESIGGECIFTSEWNEWSKKTYQANFGDDHPFIGDIVPFEEDDVPEHDVLLAGFPCQPFSIAGVSKKNSLGRPHGFECTTQGTLFFDVARIISAKKPKAFLLENVKNLVSHDGGNTFKVIIETLRDELGYDVYHKVINGSNWVPQNRERVILIGIKKDEKFSFKKNTKIRFYSILIASTAAIAIIAFFAFPIIKDEINRTQQLTVSEFAQKSKRQTVNELKETQLILSETKTIMLEKKESTVPPSGLFLKK